MQTQLIKRIADFVAGHIDSFLLTSAMLLLGVGLMTLYSASEQNIARVTGQLANVGVAFAVMWIAANIPPHILKNFAVPAYGVGIILLIAVDVAGEIVNGAQRWLNLGVTRIQPSELMKIAVPLMLAWYFDRYEATLRLKHFAVGAVLLLVPIGLIAKQPDLGTSVLILASGFYVIFLAGLSWKILLGLFAAGCASLPVLWSFMHDYQKRRILTLIDPTQDPLGAGYHTIQSTIAVGSGGVSGKGWMNGTQTHLDFLPERTTDFIFAVFSEEFGLVGNGLLLCLFLLVIGRGLIIAAEAPSLFARLLAGSIALSFFTYAFVNMGMVSGILPVVGVPLPLISYGGTALVTLFLGFGILMSIRTNRKLVQT
jgi:rod shape determining protein RodA